MYPTKTSLSGAKRRERGNCFIVNSDGLDHSPFPSGSSKVHWCLGWEVFQWEITQPMEVTYQTNGCFPGGRATVSHGSPEDFARCRAPPKRAIVYMVHDMYIIYNINILYLKMYIYMCIYITHTLYIIIHLHIENYLYISTYECIRMYRCVFSTDNTRQCLLLWFMLRIPVSTWVLQLFIVPPHHCPT